MPSTMGERNLVLKVLRDYPEIKSITDLGSGWGGMGRLIARTFPDSSVRCIELSVIPYTVSKLISSILNYKNIHYQRFNIHDYPIKRDTVYITYLSGPVMKKLCRNFKGRGAQGIVIISIAFAIPGWIPVRVEYVNSAVHAPIYVYEIS